MHKGERMKASINYLRTYRTPGRSRYASVRKPVNIGQGTRHGIKRDNLIRICALMGGWFIAIVWLV